MLILGLTHMTIGATAVSLIVQTADPTLICVGAIASLLPDIDTSNSHAGRMFPWISRAFERHFAHRSTTHSLVASLALALVTYPTFTFLGLPTALAHALNVGYFSGWFADLFTKAGVEMFYPSRSRWVMPGNRNLRLRTGSGAEYCLLAVLFALAALSFHINAHGGALAQFNRLLGSPAGVEQIYNQKGGTNLMVAHVKGVRWEDRAKVQEDFWIIDSHGKGFVVQSQDGKLYKVGTEPDVQIISEQITADVGPAAITRIQTGRLNDQDLVSALSPLTLGRPMVFVTGQLTIDDPELLAEAEALDPHEFPYIRTSGTQVTLELAPLASVQKVLNQQFATGQLTVKLIYASS